VPALRAGETTGQFGAALRHVEDYAASRARERLATALALLEPMTLTALTAVVGAIALSFFLPLFALLGGVNTR
jgi:type II secretory pathway component PulF